MSFYRKGAVSRDSALPQPSNVALRLALQSTLPQASISTPARRRSWTLCLLGAHPASRNSGSFLEITRSRRRNARTLLSGPLTRTAGQRLKNRLERRGAVRIVPVTKNLQENPDIR